jgi:hypothetical protein
VATIDDTSLKLNSYPRTATEGMWGRTGSTVLPHRASFNNRAGWWAAAALTYSELARTAAHITPGRDTLWCLSVVARTLEYTFDSMNLYCVKLSDRGARLTFREPIYGQVAQVKDPIEDKVRVVLSVLSGEMTAAEAARREPQALRARPHSTPRPLQSGGVTSRRHGM